MAAVAPWFRVAGLVLIAAGVARAVIGNINREGVNDGGVVPSALIGMLLIAVGSYALLSAYFVRTGRPWWLLLPGALAPLVVAAVGTMLIDQAHPSEYASGLRGAGYLVLAGWAICHVTVILMLSWAVMAGAMYALSGVLDLLPPLRRRGFGAKIRRTWRSPFED